jgi:hypothetical protein
MTMAAKSWKSGDLKVVPKLTRLKEHCVSGRLAKGAESSDVKDNRSLKEVLLTRIRETK